ncbi:MAG: WG repeat-containing protein [Flavobacteriales bacterium]|nr:WG repeat-containing protein [Flavobacteriales bacterium]
MRYFSLLILLFSCHTNKELIPYKTSNQWGFKDTHGNVKIKPQYDLIPYKFVNGFCSVSKNGLVGAINTKGQLVIPYKYHHIAYFNEYNDWTYVWLNGKIGIVNKNGKELLPPICEYTYGMQNGTVCASINGKWGMLNSDLDTLIPFEYKELRLASDGLALARKGAKWGFINEKNETMIPFKYAYASSFKDGKAIVGGEYFKRGMIDFHGDTIVPFVYRDLSYFVSGMARIQKKAKYGFIDTTLHEVIPPKYEWARMFEKGWAYVTTEDQFGYISRSDEVLINKYDSAHKTWGTIEAPKELYHFTDSFRQIYPPSIDFSFEKLLANGLNAFRNEPCTYAGLNKLSQICSTAGLLVAPQNYGRHKTESEKQLLIYIMSSEKLRKLAWQWAKPFYQKAFKSLHPFHKSEYKKILSYLNEYMISYDENRVRKHLKKHPWQFAYEDTEGNKHQYRKICAFIDRLIVMHKVISKKEAQTWISNIFEEVWRWE